MRVVYVHTRACTHVRVMEYNELKSGGHNARASDYTRYM